MFNYAIIDDNNLVVNTVVWDGLPGWQPLKNQTAIRLSQENEFVGIGWSYIDGTFTAPPEPIE